MLDRTICAENKMLTWAGGVIWSNDGSLASDYIRARANEVYSFNFKAQVMFYDKNKTYIGCLQSNGTIGKNTGIEITLLTIPNDTNVCYMRLGFRKVSNDNLDMTTQNIMVCYGNVDTTYTPYVKQTQLLSLPFELAKIGDYTDRIFKAVSSNNPLKPSYYEIGRASCRERV